MIRQLNPKTKIKPNHRCHLDPDLINYKSNNSWKALFGQEGSAETHLKNKKVGECDLFLFFGWFRRTEIVSGKFKYIQGEPDLHVIWGYLQVKQMWTSFEDIPISNYYHPHANLNRYSKKRNCIYVANDYFTLNKNLPGFGVLSFKEDLILTKKGYSRSKWTLPNYFKDIAISHHTKHSFKPDYFDSAKIGQEFVVEDSKDVINWAMNIIKG